MYNRIQNLNLSSQETCFLWGPRQTGKSTLLKTLFPNSIRFDLLLSTEYQRLLRRPSLIREQCQAAGWDAGSPKLPIIIDEIQKIPALLDEIHWLIENMGLRFILCGSSARKLKRGHANLLGGRAVRLDDIRCPILNVYALADHLVPATASRALAQHAGCTDYTELAFDGGHIGIYVSRHAQKQIPPKIATWLQARH